MTSPRSIRFEPRTLDRLAAYAERHLGLTSSSAAALLVEEGLRMDAHPGVVFQDGPAGRRAVLTAGPDVWEVVRAIRSTRVEQSRLSPAKIMASVSETTGLPMTAVQTAVDYYSAFPDEIDSRIESEAAAEDELMSALENSQRLLGA